MKKLTLRWRKEPKETGLARVARTSPYGLQLRLGEEVLARVDFAARQNAWFWYGHAPGKPGHNTLWVNKTFPTLAEAKEDADKTIRTQMKETT